MNRLILFLVMMVFDLGVIDAQNSVFPILNIKKSYGGIFIAAQVKANYNYLSKSVLVADKLYYYKGGYLMGEYSTSHGSYISFSYAANLMPVADWDSNWNKCITETQFAFWPGGMDGFSLCGFVLSSNRLYLVKLETDEILAEFETVNNPTAENFAYLTVFASDDINEKDRLVISGKNVFRYYDELPISAKSSVQSISRSKSSKVYYGINGQKYNEPAIGVNIAVNGDSVKKIIVK